MFNQHTSSRFMFTAAGTAALVFTLIAGGSLLTAEGSEVVPQGQQGGFIDCVSPQEYPSGTLTLTPESGAAQSLFKAELMGAIPEGGAQPLELIWDPGGNLGGPSLLEEGSIPAGMTSYQSGDLTVPANAQPGPNTVRACWRSAQFGNQWFYEDAIFDVDGPETPTPTPPLTATPTPTSTPMSTATPTPTATPPITSTSPATPGPGPRATVGSGILPLPVFFPRPPAVADPDFQIQNIEVTQSIQCLDQTVGDTACEDNEIPLVARRVTWVRVYVTSGTPDFTIHGVPVRLEVRRNGNLLATMTANVNAPPVTDRNQLGHSANFVVLCTGCNDGDVLRFTATVDPNDVFDETNEGNNGFPALELEVHQRDSIHITAVPITFQSPGQPDVTPENDQFLGDQDWMTAAFPVGRAVTMSVDPPTAWTGSLATSNWTNVANLISTLNTAYVASGSVTAPDQVMAFLPIEFNFANGVSDPLWLGGQGIVTMVDVDWYPDGAQARVMAHEVSHNLGRQHPCTATRTGRVPDPNWPYTGTGPIGLDYSIQETGVETDAIIVGIFPIPVPRVRPDNQTEMMQGGHCGFFTESNSNDIDWTSPFTYQQLFCALSPNAATSLSCRQSNAVPIGSITGLPAGAGVSSAGPAVLVSGTIDPEETGSIGNVHRLDEATPDPPGEGPFCAEVRDSTQLLHARCWEADFHVPEEPIPASPAAFNVLLPWPAGADRVVLTRSGTVLDTIALSANVPQVSVTGPAGGGQLSGEVTVAWTASDADGDDLLFTVLYSPDGGASFKPVAANITGNTVQADLGAFPGGNDAFFRVLASDNTGNTATADSAHFSVAKKPPLALVIEPQSGGQVQVGNPIVFSGSGTDPEDGVLPEDKHTWSSSIDGELATGSSALVVDLSPGLHTIRLEVEDSDGMTASDAVQVFVGTPAFFNVLPDVIPGNSGPATAHLELPNDIDISDVDTSTIRIHVGGQVFTPSAVNVGDEDQDGLADLTLNLPQALLNALPGTPDPVHVIVTGELDDGTPFMGNDLIGRTPAGDADCSGSFGAGDIAAILSWSAGLDADVPCIVYADLDCDGTVGPRDALAGLLELAGLGEGPLAFCPVVSTADLFGPLPDAGNSAASRAPGWGLAVGLVAVPGLLLPFTRRRRRRCDPQ